MTKDRETNTTKRRDFLKFATVGTVTGTAAAVIGTSPPAEAEMAGDAEGGYRETAHVKQAYALARF